MIEGDADMNKSIGEIQRLIPEIVAHLIYHT